MDEARNEHPRAPSRASGPRIAAGVLLVLVLAAGVILARRILWPEPILIGFAGQLTGKHSDLGVQGRNGATLAVEDVNAAGGIDGRPLLLRAEDDLDTPEGALAADAALAEAGAVAVIGHMTSSQTLAAGPALAARGIPLVSPTAATPLLTGLDDNFFRVITVNTHWAEALAAHARKPLDLTTAFVVGDVDNVGYTESFNAAFRETFSGLGGRVVGEHAFSSSRSGHGDWDDVARGVAALGPDAVLVTASASDTAALARALRARGVGARLLCPSWPRTSALLIEGGNAVENAIFASSFDDELTEPALRKFAERYRERYSWEPGFPAVFAYEAVLVLARGLRLTGGSPDGLLRALAPVRGLPGLIGPIHLDSAGDARRPVFISKVEHGRFTTIARIDALPAP